MTSAADRVGAGLAASRPARPIRPLERIHVVGAAGAGASAAALLGARAGAVVSGCDPAAPSPYTPALDALGIVIAPHHDPAHVTHSPHPDRLAVTKALTAIDPDHPELARRTVRRDPARAVATGRRRCRRRPDAGRRGRHPRQEHDTGWLIHVLVAVGADPSGFVGALMPGVDHRRPARDRALGAAATRSSSRPTSTPATSTRTTRPGRPDQRGVGPPGCVRR